MAIGWISLLKTVPWAQVIATAPVVAEGARKLWNGVAKKRTSPPPARGAPTQPRTESAVPLQAQVDTLEAVVADLHEQMLASSELIKALAEQNTELIKRVESNRTRLLWLWVAVVVLGAIGLARVLAS